jgi:hypothetical protein
MKRDILGPFLRASGLLMVLAAMSTKAHAAVHFPELDPGSMAGALTLLSGGVLMLTSRRRTK